MGLIYATLGEHEAAVEQFIAATALDQYLAVAYVLIHHRRLHTHPSSLDLPISPSPRYFQCGVSNFLLGRYELGTTQKLVSPLSTRRVHTAHRLVRRF